MITEILFTKSEKLGSRLIREVTKDPVSHCALRVGEFVIHSTLVGGVAILPYAKFSKDNDIIHRLKIRYEPLLVHRLLANHYGKRYDYGAFIYLGLRYFVPGIVGKQNLWQTTGMFICTEFVQRAINMEVDSMLTPYQLYKKLDLLGIKSGV